MSKLKPCPFCGGEARRYYGNIDMYGITCNKCSAKIYGYANKASATRVWNTRTADAAEVKHGCWLYNRHQGCDEKAYYCSLCNEGESDFGTDKYCNCCGAKMDGEPQEEGR